MERDMDLMRELMLIDDMLGTGIKFIPGNGGGPDVRLRSNE